MHKSIDVCHGVHKWFSTNRIFSNDIFIYIKIPWTTGWLVLILRNLCWMITHPLALPLWVIQNGNSTSERSISIPLQISTLKLSKQKCSPSSKAAWGFKLNERTLGSPGQQILWPLFILDHFFDPYVYKLYNAFQFKWSSRDNKHFHSVKFWRFNSDRSRSRVLNLLKLITIDCFSLGLYDNWDLLKHSPW